MRSSPHAGRRVLALAGCLACLATAPSAGADGAPPQGAHGPRLASGQVAETVRALEAAVRHDRERLLLLVSLPRAPGATPLHQEPELKEIARRLPQLERELERWAQLQTGPATQAEK